MDAAPPARRRVARPGADARREPRRGLARNGARLLLVRGVETERLPAARLSGRRAAGRGRHRRCTRRRSGRTRRPRWRPSLRARPRHARRPRRRAGPRARPEPAAPALAQAGGRDGCRCVRQGRAPGRSGARAARTRQRRGGARRRPGRKARALAAARARPGHARGRLDGRLQHVVSPGHRQGAEPPRVHGPRRSGRAGGYSAVCVLPARSRAPLLRATRAAPLAAGRGRRRAAPSDLGRRVASLPRRHRPYAPPPRGEPRPAARPRSPAARRPAVGAPHPRARPGTHAAGARLRTGSRCR